MLHFPGPPDALHVMGERLGEMRFVHTYCCPTFKQYFVPYSDFFPLWPGLSESSRLKRSLSAYIVVFPCSKKEEIKIASNKRQTEAGFPSTQENALSSIFIDTG